MDNKNSVTKNDLSLPWYFNTIFISALMIIGGLLIYWAIGFFFIIAGAVLIFNQRQIYKTTFLKAASICDIEAYRKQNERDIENSKEKSIREIQKVTDDNQKILKNLERLIADKNIALSEVENELSQLTSEIQVSYISPYEFKENITSEEYKNKLVLLKSKEKEYMQSDNCIKRSKFIDDGSSRALKRIEDNKIKQLLRCFNAETENIISNVSVKNADKCRLKLQKAYETINKIFETTGLIISEKCLKFKLDELSLIYDYELKLEQERELQKEIKEQLKEEEKVRREIEDAKKRLDKEESQFKNEISKLMKYLQNASDVEKQLYIDKINELEEKVKALETDRQNVLQREQNTRAGFVYIISNIGSFGENVYKIGMTRRLEPMDRIKELSNASVPFEFDVHAIIFSDDAPALESILHKTFEKNAVNKVNHRKEFYKINLQEVEKIVKENHNATVTFTELPVAEQYYATLQIEQENK